MFYSTEPNEKFLLENRKKLVLQAIEFSGKLKNHQAEYNIYCELIKELNKCSLSTDSFLDNIKSTKQSLLSSDDWSPLERAVLYEKRLSKTFGRNETQNKLNRLNLQLFASALVPCLFIGGNIALCVLVTPVFVLLFIATIFSILSLTCVGDYSQQRETLLNTLHKDAYKSDYTDGLAFSPEVLDTKLEATKDTMQSTSWFGLFSADPSAPTLIAEAHVVNDELKGQELDYTR